MLSAIPLFSELSSEAFVDAIMKGEIRWASPGEIVIREGVFGMNLFIIVSGKVRVFRDTSEGAQTLAELGEGVFFGEMSLILLAPRRVLVVVIESVMFFEFSRQAMEELIDRYLSVDCILMYFFWCCLILNAIANFLLFAQFGYREREYLFDLFEV